MPASEIEPHATTTAIAAAKGRAGAGDSGIQVLSTRPDPEVAASRAEDRQLPTDQELFMNQEPSNAGGRLMIRPAGATGHHCEVDEAIRASSRATPGRR
jgi:hypothetical protein